MQIGAAASSQTMQILSEGMDACETGRAVLLNRENRFVRRFEGSW